VTAVAYIGPTIYGVVRQATVLRGGVPEALEEKIREVPELRALLVPLNRFAQSWQDVNTEGTAEHSFFMSAQQSMYPEPEGMEVNFDG